MKRIIIIGATSGIGRSLAILYLQQGCRIGITGRREALLKQLQEQYPAQTEYACFDAAGVENIPQLERLIDKLGGMDIFIYNAGYGEPSAQLDVAVDMDSTRVNVNGFLEMTGYAFNYLQQQGGGQIAATSSVAANRGNSHAPAYSAGKAFMSTYMEGLHIKNRRMKGNVAVTDIQPGFVRTKMAKGHGQFWVAPVEKAAVQIHHAIARKKRRAFITRRWAVIAWLMRRMPYFIYSRIG